MDPYRAMPLAKPQWQQLFKAFFTRFPRARGVVSLAQYQTHASRLELERDQEKYMRVAAKFPRPITGGITAEFTRSEKIGNAIDLIKQEIRDRDRSWCVDELEGDEEEERGPRQTRDALLSAATRTTAADQATARAQKRVRAERPVDTIAAPPLAPRSPAPSNGRPTTDRKRFKSANTIQKKIGLRIRRSRYSEDDSEDDSEEDEDKALPQTRATLSSAEARTATDQGTEERTRAERPVETNAAPPSLSPNGEPLFTDQERRWIRSQLSRFPRIPTTDFAWKALLKAFCTEFPHWHGRLTVKQYTDEAIRIDSERQKEEMQRQEDRRRKSKNHAKWVECIAIKQELQRRDDHTFVFLTRESDEEDPDIQQIWQSPRPDEASVMRERLVAVGASAQQWKTKYETEHATTQRVRTRLAARDEELKAADERVRSLETALREAEEKVQRLEAAAAAAMAEPPQRPQATTPETTAAPVAPVAVDPTRQSASGVTFVINLNLGDIMRATGA